MESDNSQLPTSNPQGTLRRSARNPLGVGTLESWELAVSVPSSEHVISIAVRLSCAERGFRRARCGTPALQESS